MNYIILTYEISNIFEVCLNNSQNRKWQMICIDVLSELNCISPLKFRASVGWDLRIWFSSGFLWKLVKAVFIQSDLLYCNNSSLSQYKVFSGGIYACHLMQSALDLN